MVLDPQGTQIRRDPLTGDTVLMASQRLARPSDFVTLAHAQREVDCPFCPENEAETPQPRCDYPACDSDRDPGSQKRVWSARVVPNRYPAIEARHGRHQVVIESARHVSTWAELTEEERYYSLFAYQDQLRRNAAAGLAYTQIFKNCGAEAGASIIHSHSQILATPFVPSRVQAQVVGAARYQRRTKRCFFCDLTSKETEGDLGHRICTTPHFVAVCPEFSRFPYETWVLPRQHQHQFEMQDPGHLRELASMIDDVAGAFQAVIPQSAYNWMLQTAPHRWAEDVSADISADIDAAENSETPADRLSSAFHWRLEMFPRLAKLGGFELATGGYINIVNPGEAAEQLSATMHSHHASQPVPGRKTS